MSVQNLLQALFSQASGSRIRADILKCADLILQNPDGPLVPVNAFACVGMDPAQDRVPDHSIMEKEYFYFEKCLTAVRTFMSGHHPEAVELLMKAKWDFDDYALAHYLLGLVFFEMRNYKGAYEQFLNACNQEPYNRQPMEIMRELTFTILMAPSRQ